MNARLFRVSVTLAAAFAFAVLNGTTSAQSKDPVIGKWNLNVAKSKYSPGPAPKSAVATVTAAGADGIKIVFDAVTATGDKVHWEYTANFDGKDYPMTGNPDGDTIMLKRINANTAESTYKKGGKPTLTVVRTVSADGKTLTVTVKGTDAQGQKVDNLLIFDKA